VSSNVLLLRLPATEQLRLAVCSAREATGLSLLRAALDVKCSPDTILAWEHGDSRPDVAKLLDAPKMGPAFAAELGRVISLRLAAAGPSPKEAHHAASAVTLTIPNLSVAHSGHVPNEEDSNTGERSQRGVSPAALMLVGDQALPSASGRGAKASEEQRPAGAPSRVVRRTDGVSAVAQPGSARRPELPGAEVVGSNPIGGSNAARATCGKVDCTAGPATARAFAGIEVVRIDRAALKKPEAA
jgi:hypothetical protein